VCLLGDAVSSPWPLLPLLVFVAELCVVTLSTMRMIFIARGMKLLAPFLGIFEISIWLFAIGQIMQNLSDVGCYAGFASGFTLGNFLGVIIEKKLAIGNSIIHITTRKDASGLVESLAAAQYGVTCINARGATGPVQIVYTVVKRKELARVVAIIKSFDAKAFYSINDLQAAAEGVFPSSRARGLMPLPAPFFRTAP
jgi:uncharacterized protein YebE (UPF0316 family)